MPPKPRRQALNKLNQAISAMTRATEILINDLTPYAKRFPEINEVLEGCILCLDKIIDAIKEVKTAI